MKKQGYLLTLEGIEGAGKSTAVQIISNFLQQYNIDFIITREPGGTEIAERIREIILNNYQERMHPDTEILLYFASRAQHINNVILPSLENGKMIICDRFTDATYAYQGGGRGLSNEKISILEKLVQNTLKPNFTLLFDVTVNSGFNRILNNRKFDRIENEKYAFFRRIRNKYLQLANNEPDRFHIINSNNSLTQVTHDIISIMKFIVKKLYIL